MGLTKPRAAQIYNLDYKQAVRAVAVSNVTLAGGAPAVVDGVTLAVNDRVLCTGQSTGSQNLIYIVTTVGSGSNGTWTTAYDDNTTGELDAGTIVMVTEGLIYADTQWKLITDNPITIGTTSLTWTQNYSANSISAGTSNVVVSSNANVIISSAGTSGVLTISSTGTVVKGTESVTGNITGGNILTTGLISLAGNIYTGNILTNGYYYANGTVFAGGGGGGTPGGANTQIQYNNNGIFGGSAALTFNNTTNAVATTGTFSATSNITGGNILTGGIASATGNLYGNNISAVGDVRSNNLLTAGVASATGNVTGGNIITGGLISSTGNATVGNISATNYTGTTVSITGTVTAASTVGGVITGSSASVTGTVTAASTVGGVITGSSVSVTGNVTAAGHVGTVYTNSIINTGANGVGNIGSSTLYFNTVFAKATSAQYADLAEMYCADSFYPPGTVVEFGGVHEITTTRDSHSTRVAGVISTNPSYLMNSTLSCEENALEVALVGRVPCQVIGPIKKGDRIVSSVLPGVAQALDMTHYQPGCIIGKALENYNSEEVGTIEVVVGRF